ncbi:hypothetical protein HAX54_044940 [Datura stramonium]|uniref:Uncharacterized protein n=1 Tax=Datura stramonium TaxID=4076 RepID=A0ABS8SQD1_DATST|nr:hypothetical protein [Datura stramonium]
MQGRLSAWLVKHGLIHRSMGFDYQGIETLQIKPEDWRSIAIIFYVYEYNYLRSQCAYDVAPGGLLASVYHITRIEDGVDQLEELQAEEFFQLNGDRNGCRPNPEGNYVEALQNYYEAMRLEIDPYDQSYILIIWAYPHKLSNSTVQKFARLGSIRLADLGNEAIALTPGQWNLYAQNPDSRSHLFGTTKGRAPLDLGIPS